MPDLESPWLRAWALGQAPPPDTGDAIVVHPGSGSPAKNWPTDRWADVITRLRRRVRAPVVIVQGPADARPGRELGAAMAGDAVRMVNPDLRQVAATLCRARIYLGNDSGVSHLAGLVGAPSVVVFGPSSPRTWTPAGPRVAPVAVSHGPRPIRDLPAGPVVSAATGLLGVSPA